MPVVVYIMAANMKFGRCSSHTNMLFMTLFMLNIFSLQVRCVEGTTTVPAALTTPAATPPAPTTTLVPTTAQAQTTTPTPGRTTAAPSSIPENTDISPCPCDLTGNACDINCCCDGDCSANDKKAFSECLKYSYRIDDKLCFQKELILKENSPYVSTITSNNLFCITLDNRPQRNFYNNPDLVQNNVTFQNYVQKYGSFSFQLDVPKTPTTYADFYKSGDMIYSVFPSQSVGILGLPKALSSPYCTDGNPAAYLYNQFHECVRQLTDLVTQCPSMSALDASTYYLNFRVVSVPALFQRYTPAPIVNGSSNGTVKTPTGPQAAVDLTKVVDLYNNTYTLPVTLDVVLCKDASGVTTPCTISSPTLNAAGTMCDNVVVNVTYRMVYNGTKGIVSVSADVVLANIPVSTQTLAQTFASVFTAEGAPPTPFQRSGNPGYVQGEPVMVGGLNTTDDPITGKKKDEILLNMNRNRWLTLVRSTPGGDCITDINQDRVSVTFKDDIRSGCIMNISQTTLSCQRLQQIIINTLEGDFPTNKPYVAIFGNSDIKQVGDWIPIWSNKPATSGTQTSTCFLSLGMHVQVLYANVGSLLNPQPKIIGLSFLYDSRQEINYKCGGPYCLDGTEGLVQQIEISTSVSFIDVSQAAIPYEAERPVFVAKVPYDFFYPFLSNSPARSPSYLILFMCSLSVMFVNVLSPMS